jgi:hypothetical protein
MVMMGIIIYLILIMVYFATHMPDISVLKGKSFLKNNPLKASCCPKDRKYKYMGALCSVEEQLENKKGEIEGFSFKKLGKSIGGGFKKAGRGIVSVSKKAGSGIVKVSKKAGGGIVKVGNVAGGIAKGMIMDNINDAKKFAAAAKRGDFKGMASSAGSLLVGSKLKLVGNIIAVIPGGAALQRKLLTTVLNAIPIPGLEGIKAGIIDGIMKKTSSIISNINKVRELPIVSKESNKALAKVGMSKKSITKPQLSKTIKSIIINARIPKLSPTERAKLVSDITTIQLNKKLNNLQKDALINSLINKTVVTKVIPAFAPTITASNSKLLSNAILNTSTIENVDTLKLLASTTRIPAEKTRIQVSFLKKTIIPLAIERGSSVAPICCSGQMNIGLNCYNTCPVGMVYDPSSPGNCVPASLVNQVLTAMTFGQVNIASYGIL